MTVVDVTRIHEFEVDLYERLPRYRSDLNVVHVSYSLFIAQIRVDVPMKHLEDSKLQLFGTNALIERRHV